jgi:hypothetical protein
MVAHPVSHHDRHRDAEVEQGAQIAACATPALPSSDTRRARTQRGAGALRERRTDPVRDGPVGLGREGAAPTGPALAG